MSSFRRPTPRVVRAMLLTALTIGCAAPQVAAAPSSSTLRNQISSGNSQIGTLSSALGQASARLSALNASVASIESRVARVQGELSSERAQLLSLRLQSGRARARLALLQQMQARAESTLAAQLISAYESDRPDMVTVVLEARGFSDLLERLSFAARVRRQTVRITTSVKIARRAVAAQAIRLGALAERQQALTLHVLAQRNALDRDRAAVVGQQQAAARLHDARAGALADARGHVAALSSQLAKLQAAQAAAAAAAAPSAGSGTSASSGGVSTGSTPPPSSGGAPSSGGFTFPLPKGSVSPPGTWSLDQGVDMSAPGSTPEYAVCAGTIVLHGIGGFGPWAPVLHCDSPLDGYSYVYYGHAGPDNQLSVGSHVGAGQAMSSVGPGIVGISSGPHIEIGFADASGTPVGGGSASTMMSLLQGSY